jgi:hypothetical protein
MSKNKIPVTIHMKKRILDKIKQYADKIECSPENAVEWIVEQYFIRENKNYIIKDD